MELRLAGRWVFRKRVDRLVIRAFTRLLLLRLHRCAAAAAADNIFPTPMPRYGRFHIGAFRHSKHVAVLVRITSLPVSFRSFFGRGR